MFQVSLPFSREEYASRLHKVRVSMASRGIDVLVVSDPSNMGWLTGYDGWSFYVHQCVLVGLEGEPVWYGRRQDANGAWRTCWMDAERVRYYPDYYVQNPDMHPMEYLAQSVLPEYGWHTGNVGLEMDNYYFSGKAYTSLLKELPHAQLVDATALVNWCRAIKSPQEIAYMRTAARIVECMHTRIIEMIEPGLAKSKLVSEIYRVGTEGWTDEHGKVHGGDYPAIVPLLPTGSDAAAPHLTWDDTPFRKGEGTFFEIAGCYKRYHAPLSRTVFLGKPPQDFIRGGQVRLRPGRRALRLSDRDQLSAGLGRAHHESASLRRDDPRTRHDLPLHAWHVDGRLGARDHRKHPDHRERCRAAVQFSAPAVRQVRRVSCSSNKNVPGVRESRSFVKVDRGTRPNSGPGARHESGSPGYFATFQ